MTPALTNNPLFRGITPEKLSANLEEISFHTRSYRNRFPVEVTANEPTEVIEIPKASVLELFRRNEQFLENYMNLSANYARTLSDKLFFMSFKTIRQKIASYLLRLYKQQQQLQITLDRSQQELSDYFGVSRPSLARELSHMQEDGMIIADRKQITILQKEWLIRLIQ